jgi:hypothetical protein
VLAVTTEIHGDHLVFLNSEGKLAALFLMEMVESWTVISGKEKNGTARRFSQGVYLSHGRTDTNTDRGTRRWGWVARDVFGRNKRWICG